MVVIRATQKLLSRLSLPAVDAPPSTTLLGDWYAKPFDAGRRQLVILASEHSRLAVLLSVDDVSELPSRFADAFGAQLKRLGIAQGAIDSELAACREVVVATPTNKSLLATLNEYAALATQRLRGASACDLDLEAFSLNNTPLASLGYRFPSEVALGLFGLESTSGRGPF